MIENVTLKRRLPPLWFPAKQPRLNDHWSCPDLDPHVDPPARLDRLSASSIGPPVALFPLDPSPKAFALPSISQFLERFPPRHPDLVQATIHPQTLGLLRDKKCPSRPSLLTTCSSCTRGIESGSKVSRGCDACAKLTCSPCLNACLSCDRTVCGNCSYGTTPDGVQCADCQSLM